MSSPAIDALFERYGPKYRQLVVLTAMLGTISAVLTATMINVAIPDIMGAFGVGQDRAQWLSTGFLAAMTIAMLLNDWSVRSFGMRATYLGAMTVFACGSVLGGVTTNFDLIVIARVLQGAGAGLVQPLAMVVMFLVFPPAQRGRAMGLFGMGVVLAPALGPTLGGVLVDAYNWRAVFFAAIPVSTLGMLLASLFMPQREHEGPRPGFDWTGFLLLCLFVGYLLTSLSNGQREGWHSASVSIGFAVAAVSFMAFVAWELVVKQPMLNIRIFAEPGFAGAALVGIIFGSMLFGSTYLVPLFVQTVQGYTATRAGLLMVPAGLLMMVLFPIAGRLADRVPPRWPITCGLLVFCVSSYLMTAGDADTPFWTFAIWLLIGRIGLAFLMPTLSVGAMRSLSPDLLSQGSGALNFARQLGGAFGINLLAVNLEMQTAHYVDRLGSTQSPDNPLTMELMRELSRLFDSLGLPETLHLPGTINYLVHTVEAQALMMAFRVDFLAVALVSLLAIAPAWLIGYRHREPRLLART